MNDLEKEINVKNQCDMMRRYQMYGAAMSQQMEKSQDETKKEERK